MVKPTHSSDHPVNNPRSFVCRDTCLDWNDQRFRKALGLELDLRFAVDGNTLCDGDVTIELIDGTCHQRVLSCSLKATIDEVVEDWDPTLDDDGSEVGTTEMAAKNLLALGDHLRAAAERLRAKATERD